jgi:hypothetical protein
LRVVKTKSDECVWRGIPDTKIVLTSFANKVGRKVDDVGAADLEIEEFAQAEIAERDLDGIKEGTASPVILIGTEFEMRGLENGGIFRGSGRRIFGKEERARADEGAVGLDTVDEITARGQLFEKIGHGARGVNVHAAFRCRDLQTRRKKRLKCGDDVFGSERGAVGEFHAGTEFELPGLEGGVVRPLDGDSGLEVAVIVKDEEPIVEKSGELGVLGVFCSGNGAGFPLARVEGGFGGLEFEAERAAVDRVFGGEQIGGSEEEQNEEEKLLKPLALARAHSQNGCATLSCRRRG